MSHGLGWVGRRQPCLLLAVGLAWMISGPGGAWAGAPASGAREAPRAEDSVSAPAAPEAREARPALSEQLSELWRSGSGSVAERSRALRLEALRLGIPELEAPARALLLERRGSALERARAAVELAPGLPAAHAALARALLLDDHDPVGAMRAALAGLAHLDDHLEALLWVLASASLLGVAALLAAALGFLVLAALTTLPGALHDLGDVLGRGAPGFARAALLLALLGLPWVLGEGITGAAAALFAIAFCYAAAARRVALLLGAGLIAAALYPGSELVGRTLEAFESDAVAEAAYEAEHGVASALALARLERADGRHPLAESALAIQARREGRLEHADQRYRRLVEGAEPDARILNNAANVRLALGDAEGAIELYQRALDQEPEAAAIWFNLAQAYGHAIRVEEHDEALLRAQSLDEPLVRALTEVLMASEGSYTLDLAIPAREVVGRILSTPQPRAAAELRAHLAPGRLGRGLPALAGTFMALAVLAAAIGSRFEPSRRCSQCGRRACPRCSTKPATATLCQACARLLQRPDEGTQRSRRLESMRRRTRRTERVARTLSWLVPGAAGVLHERPLAALLSLALFCAALALGLAGPRLLPDPLAAGAAGPWLFAGVGLAAALAYLLITGVTLLRGRA